MKNIVIKNFNDYNAFKFITKCNSLEICTNTDIDYFTQTLEFPNLVSVTNIYISASVPLVIFPLVKKIVILEIDCCHPEHSLIQFPELITARDIINNNESILQFPKLDSVHYFYFSTMYEDDRKYNLSSLKQINTTTFCIGYHMINESILKKVNINKIDTTISTCFDIIFKYDLTKYFINLEILTWKETYAALNLDDILYFLENEKPENYNVFKTEILDVFNSNDVIDTKIFNNKHISLLELNKPFINSFINEIILFKNL